MGFFKVIFIIIFVFIVLGWLFRLFLPYILRFFVKRMMGGQGAPKKEKKQESGKVTIKENQDHSSDIPNDLGEYTDFEEIKDPKE